MITNVKDMSVTMIRRENRIKTVIKRLTSARGEGEIKYLRV